MPGIPPVAANGISYKVVFFPAVTVASGRAFTLNWILSPGSNDKFPSGNVSTLSMFNVVTGFWSGGFVYEKLTVLLMFCPSCVAVTVKLVSPSAKFTSLAKAPLEYTFKRWPLIETWQVVQVEPIINCLELFTSLVVL